MKLLGEIVKSLLLMAQNHMKQEIIGIKYLKVNKMDIKEAINETLSHDIYLFKVYDYTTILLGRYHNGIFYVQRGDGFKYEYTENRVVWKKLLTLK